jgi:hypothetical protein
MVTIVVQQFEGFIFDLDGAITNASVAKTVVQHLIRFARLRRGRRGLGTRASRDPGHGNFTTLVFAQVAESLQPSRLNAY